MDLWQVEVGIMRLNKATSCSPNCEINDDAERDDCEYATKKQAQELRGTTRI
jgi:hypothetical protein